MLNPNLSLNPNLFLSTTEKVPIRKGFGKGLLQAGEQDERVVALCCDLTESTQVHLFAEKFPKRFVQMGIAEQSMASVASGMAAMGKVPFFSSYAMFSPGRNWEQIRTTICYNNANCKIIGSHAGISVGPDGGTHQALEDIAITRVIPNMVVLTPCDAEEARKATIAASEYVGPVYIRLQREATPVITSETTPFAIGKAQVFFQTTNPKVTIFTCGAMTHTGLMVAKKLEEQGVGSIVVHVATVKPLDEACVSFAVETGLAVTIEEHQRVGGLGGAIAELLSERSPMPVIRFGVNDQFGQSGEPVELLKQYQLDSEYISATILGILV